jgi:hypothetical protein
MSDQRKPLVGWTYDPEPNYDGWHRVYDKDGDHFEDALPECIGIPAPLPPRTGTLGLSEEDTREAAAIPVWSDRQTFGRCYNAAIESCRDDVARWDAEDEAAANAEPETLTPPPLPVGAIRCIAEMDWSSTFLNTARDACRAALENAGLA